MIRNLVGLALYFAGIGVWFVLFLWLGVWVAILVVPTTIMAFVAGYLTNFFKRTSEWPAFRNFWLWDTLRSYYFHFEVGGDPEGIEATKNAQAGKLQVIWAIYPHGHYSLTALFWWALNPAFARAQGAVHSIFFYVPILGAVAGWLGATTVVESDMRAALRNGRSLYMCPGGVADIANVGTVVKKRRGFLRVAQATKTAVVPVWCPDERSYYCQWLPLGHYLEQWLGFPIPIFIMGRWWCPVLPLPVVRSRVLYGRPITWDDNLSLAEAEQTYWATLADLQRTRSPRVS